MVDPISAAAGAAAGAAGKVAGKAISKTAADPKLRNALLLPVATVIGKEWARNAEEFFERGRARRIENLGRHVDEAIRINGREKIEAIEEEPAFHEWADEVSKVNPADEELSAIWQAALRELEQGGPERLRLLSIAKSLRPDEAAALVLFARKRRRLPLSYRKKFLDVDVITTRIIQMFFGNAWVSLFFSPVFASISVMLGLLGMLYTQLLLTTPEAMYVISFLAFVALAPLALLFLFLQRPILTKTGRALTALAVG